MKSFYYSMTVFLHPDSFKCLIFFQISNNDFKDIGYIGIAVDYNNQPNSQLATKNVLVANNTMSGCGVTNMFQVRGFTEVSVKNFTVRISI